jgi:hypothetical protein
LLVKDDSVTADKIDIRVSRLTQASLQLNRAGSMGFRALASISFLLAAFAPTPAVFELHDVDLSGWDCATNPEGAAKTEDGKERNRQKNRAPISLKEAPVVEFDVPAFLARVAEFDRQTGKKHRRFLTAAEKEKAAALENQVVSLTGWLVLAYQGVPETTNCRSRDFLDWHLELSPEPADHPAQIGDPTPIICEITPRSEGTLYRSGVRIQKLAAFIRLPDNTFVATGGKAHKIRVTGYLLWDDEHNKDDSDIGPWIGWFSKEGYHHPWRATAWEIHPVIKVEDLGTQ